MSDLIITSYLENSQLKAKIVKDSDDLWEALICSLKQKWNRATKEATIAEWKKEDSKINFGERVLEHVTYWVLVKRDNLTESQAKKKLQELDLYQRIRVVEHLF